MKIYAGYSDGFRTRGPCVVLVRARAHWEALPLPGAHTRGEIWWGDGGSGALVLAQAILADYFGHAPPAELCRLFTWEVVGRWPQGYRWRLDSAAIENWLARVAARATRTSQHSAED
jgi:hypothetical protein